MCSFLVKAPRREMVCSVVTVALLVVGISSAETAGDDVATSAILKHRLTDVLTVEATGFRYHRGQAVAMLFRRGSKIGKTPFKQAHAPIRDGTAAISFPALPYESYGLVVFHDENRNDALDHSIIGLPKEPMGFSGGFELSLFSGKPKFDELAFTFNAKSRTQCVRVH